MMARAHPRPLGEEGIALVCALMVAALLGTLGGALVFLVTTESMISANHRAAQQALYAAEAGVERAIGGLRTLPDWRTVPGTSGEPAMRDFLDTGLAPRLGDGTILDLARLTAARQAASNVRYPASANRPVWRVLAHAPLARLIASSVISSPAYVIVWIADDVDETDGDPLHDSNDVLMIRAEAFGLRGARRRIEALLARERQVDGTVPAPEGNAAADGVQRTEVRMVGWREVQ